MMGKKWQQYGLWGKWYGFKEYLREVPWVKNLPHLLTFLNLTMGLCAIKFTFMGWYREAVITILIGVALDYFDGKLARRLDASSEFGKQLDSLSDLVSFGVAPAVLCWIILPFEPFWLGILLIIFLVCGAYRLARFNSAQTNRSPKGKHFWGLPITVAGGFLTVASFHYYLFPLPLFYLLLPLLAAAMISKISITPS